MAIIKTDHRAIIRRILCKNVGAFLPLQNHPFLDHSITHEYSSQLRCKSEVVSLGILNQNQATHEGTKHVIKFMEQYLPKVDGEVYGCVAAGDCLTFKNINNAMAHAFNASDADEMYENIYPSLGQFHLRVMSTSFYYIVATRIP